LGISLQGECDNNTADDFQGPERQRLRQPKSTVKKKISLRLVKRVAIVPQDIEKLPPTGGQSNMSQGMLSFKYEEEKTLISPISLADLSVYLDLVKVIALGNAIAPLALV